MTSMSAGDFAKQSMNCHVRFRGFPKALTSDRGPNGAGDIWRYLCKAAKIEQRLSTAFHPESDGATELMNQEVLAFLSSFIFYAQFDWPHMLPTAQLALKNRNNTNYGVSPFFLEHGYNIEPIQQTWLDPNKKQSSKTRSAENFISRAKQAEEYAGAAMAAAQQWMEDQANKSCNRAPLFWIGDKVWLSLKNIQTPQPKKK